MSTHTNNWGNSFVVRNVDTYSLTLCITIFIIRASSFVKRDPMTGITIQIKDSMYEEIIKLFFFLGGSYVFSALGP
jgi:hypothetical protein